MTFRFEGLDIWKKVIEIGNRLLDIADRLREMKKYRFAEQLDSATLSISNNITEGADSFSDRDFANFLNYSRRSVFECANILSVLQYRNIIDNE
nr:four helix bundle protein [Bacteroidota bacterium]